MNEAFVSVITPFRNTAPYLGQCIESVLRQSYSRFEYILSDNCSTDGSREIAEHYARQDSRIRLIYRDSPIGQVEHYNKALAEISEASQYCKIVQADDCIFPECLRLMVRAFEQSESIGLVSSYDLKGNTVRGSGFPYPTPVLSGREMAKMYLRSPVWVFGSPSTVMYRSFLIRECEAFYDESLLHEDTEKCMQILRDWDFGFVHQVLSFLRTDNVNESISAGFRSFQPNALDRYIIVQRYAPVFLATDEATALMKDAKREYYRVLAAEALRFRGAAFWKYHQGGLKTLSQRIDLRPLTVQIGWQLLRLAGNPGTTAAQALRACKERISWKGAFRDPPGFGKDAATTRLDRVGNASPSEAHK